ncbi:hypothetical protein GCM10027614_69770 [Micromonospora vulcania]
MPARDVFTKPTALGWAEAANLLLVGSAAAEMLHRTELADGDVVLVHGASGAVGISAVQQAKLRGARVIGTASPRNWDLLRRFGAEPVAYGAGLEQRVRDLTEHVDVAFDAVGTDEAVDVSLALVADRRRIASSAAFDRAGPEGFWIVGHETGSVTYRDQVREHLIELAGTGRLTVPMARTFPSRRRSPRWTWWPRDIPAARSHCSCETAGWVRTTRTSPLSRGHPRDGGFPPEAAALGQRKARRARVHRQCCLPVRGGSTVRAGARVGSSTRLRPG